MKDYSRKITLYCPLCGNDQFESLDVEHEDAIDAPDTVRFKCSDCKSIYTKAELIESNNESIEDNIEEVQKSFLRILRKRLRKFSNEVC